MPRHSVLPHVDLDSRTGTELIRAAMAQVYESSNQQLNDFSPGSPISALIEGQVFAQEELLQYANQYPESVLIEWISQFLGAQRRVGAGALVELTFEISRSAEDFFIFAGYQVQTPPLSDGSPGVTFVTTERLAIPSGLTTGKVQAISVLRSRQANVAARTITKPVTNLAGVLSVTNEYPALGGQNPELIQEVKERFFSLIHRRNPTSREDWEDFFVDILGPGTVTTVVPRNSGQIRLSSNEATNSDPAVSLYVLNPDGTPITQLQQTNLNRLVRARIPLTFQGFVYPMEVSEVDFQLVLTYDPTKDYAIDLINLATQIRRSLRAVMRPGNTFPLSYTPTLGDVEGALTERFSQVFGEVNRYVDPDVRSIVAYTTPPGLVKQKITADVLQYAAGELLQTNDLVVEIDFRGNRIHYPVLKPFTPATNTKAYYANTGLLELQLLKQYDRGEYKAGDVVLIGENIHIVINDHFNSRTYRFHTESNQSNRIQNLTESDLLTEALDYTDWTVGVELTGNSTIVRFEEQDTPFTTAIPGVGVAEGIDKYHRSGYPVWRVRQDFTIQKSSADLNRLQLDGVVAPRQAPVAVLTPGVTYQTGQYVRTPTPRVGAFQACYVTPLEGASVIYARVLESFTMDSLNNTEIKTALDTLVDQRKLQRVETVPFVNCKAQGVYSLRPYKYQTRFGLGEYIKTTDYDTKQADYYFVLRDFTPNSKNVEDLLSQKFVAKVSDQIFNSTYQLTVSHTHNITKSITEYVKQHNLENGQTILIQNNQGQVAGIWTYYDQKWFKLTENLPIHRDLYRLNQGDVVSLHDTYMEANYEVLQSFTPVAAAELYIEHGILQPTEKPVTKQWVDKSYRIEDIVETANSQKFYRTILPFTPQSSGLNTIQQSEDAGFTQKIVTKPSAITPRLRSGLSVNAIGNTQITLTSKENAETTQTGFFGGRVQYGRGTFAI